MTTTHAFSVAHHVRRFLIAAIALLAYGCEETVNITDSIYRERLVVHGVIHADSAITVKITRTVPIDKLYSEADATINDVTASITVENPSDGSVVERFDLIYKSNGRYVAPSSASLARGGLRYRFNASWHGHSVYATTVVPLPIAIDSVDMYTRLPEQEWEDTLQQVRAYIRPREGETYFLTSARIDEYTNEIQLNDTYGGARLLRARDANAAGLLELIDMFWGYRGPSLEGPDVAVVVAYDEPYYEFQQTFYSHTDRGPFGTGADLVHWTVEGDGIGLFIGRSFSMRRL